jgi:hypothetical protein
MEIFKHSSCNAELGVGPELAAQGVVPLPINRSNENGIEMVQSFWKPDAVELAAINAGHPIILTIWGETHTPVKLEVARDKE